MFMKKLSQLLNKYKDIEQYYQYQTELTTRLDCYEGEFTQNIINEIVLWKVNRYAQLSIETIEVLNEIQLTDKIIDVELTKRALELLLNTKGIQLPMASAILRFRNKYIYQILDQRVFRIISNGELLGNKLKSYYKTPTKIDFYVQYLDDLHKFCDLYEIDFTVADRVIYLADAEFNKDKPLENY